MATTQAFTWPQGADLEIQLKYKEGVDAQSAVLIDLSTDYDVRMDIVVPVTKERIYTFNSSALADVDPGAPVVPDNTLEGVLTSGAGDTPNINITVPRSLTLPGGEVYAKMIEAPPIITFNYDIFLRNNVTDKQAKILSGTVTIEASHTLWP